MGCIETPSCLVTDSSLVSTSLWFRAPTLAQLFAQYGGSSISLRVRLFNSEDIDENARYRIVYAVTANTFGFRDFGFSVETGNVGAADATTWSAGDVTVNDGGWNHLFVATDTNHAGEFPSGNFGGPLPTSWDGKVGWIYLNGVSVGSGASMGATHVPSLPADDGGVDDRGSGPTTYTEAYACGFNGLNIGIPDSSSDRAVADRPQATTSMVLRMADFQMWVGQFIDPTDPTNLAKFFTSAGAGKIKPVDPAIAAAAFGQQTFLFARDKKKGFLFETNRGSGGAFTKTGTVADFSPGPGQ